MNINNRSLCYYPFMFNLDRCNESINIHDDPLGKIYIVNKIDDVNLIVCNIVTRINESKTLTKHISCKYTCKFDGRNVIRIKSGTTINLDVSVKTQENFKRDKKLVFRIQVHVLVKMVKTLKILLMIQQLHAIKLIT